MGKRGKERDEEGGGTTTADRLDVTPVRTVTIRAHDLEPALVGSKGAGA
jgi:hypothetical protein